MFEKLVGNERIKHELSNVSEPSHAYMFTGPEGIGKFLFAKEFANKFLCISENKPCYKCKACIQFASNNNMDFYIIDSLENSIKIKQIRDMISKIYEKPILSNKKVYIINNADKMTTEAQNCLLKILEEPPQYVMIILIVSNEHAMLNTIKSRCIKIRFEKIDNDELANYLEKNGQIVTKEKINIYNGSIGKALLLQGNEDKYIQINNITELTSKIDYLKISKIIYDDKENIINYLEYLNTLYYNKLRDNIKYTISINKINDAIGKLRYNSNIEMLLDELFLNLWDIQQTCSGALYAP